MAGVGSKLAFGLLGKQTARPLVSLPSMTSRAFLGHESKLFSTSAASLLLNSQALTVNRGIHPNLYPYQLLSIQTPRRSMASASIAVRHQMPVLLLPLPSRRNEAGCEFIIRPSSSTVEELLEAIQKEDPGIERIHVTVDGTRIAKRTAMQHLLAKGFNLHINGVVYPVAPMPENLAPVRVGLWHKFYEKLAN